MSGKFPSRGDFSISTSLFDEHEWMVDYLIDGELGSDCVITYPDVESPCDNCYQDPMTRKSAHIYNGSGPQSFTNNTLCPRCNGEGVLSAPSTATIRVRVYWDSKDWRGFGVTLKYPDASAMMIGYMSDLQKIRNAHFFTITYDDVKLQCRTMGEAQPHGFRHDRYFVQMIERI